MKTLNETNFSNHNRDAERGEHGDGAGRSRVTQPFTIAGGIASEPQRPKASSLPVRNSIFRASKSCPAWERRATPSDLIALIQQAQGEDAPFNQTILRFPGVAQDSFGQLHLRGEHANLPVPHQRRAVAGRNHRLRPGIVDPICRQHFVDYRRVPCAVWLPDDRCASMFTPKRERSSPVAKPRSKLAASTPSCRASNMAVSLES